MKKNEQAVEFFDDLKLEDLVVHRKPQRVPLDYMTGWRRDLHSTNQKDKEDAIAGIQSRIWTCLGTFFGIEGITPHPFYELVADYKFLRLGLKPPVPFEIDKSFLRGDKDTVVNRLSTIIEAYDNFLIVRAFLPSVLAYFKTTEEINPEFKTITTEEFWERMETVDTKIKELKKKRDYDLGELENPQRLLELAKENLECDFRINVANAFGEIFLGQGVESGEL